MLRPLYLAPLLPRLLWLNLSTDLSWLETGYINPLGGGLFLLCFPSGFFSCNKIGLFGRLDSQLVFTIRISKFPDICNFIIKVFIISKESVE